jgi:hypothetical protein
MFNRKVESNRKDKASDNITKRKVKNNVFGVKCFFVCQSSTKAIARGKIRALYNNFQVFSNFPYNDRQLRFDEKVSIPLLSK